MAFGFNPCQPCCTPPPCEPSNCDCQNYLLTIGANAYSGGVGGPALTLLPVPGATVALQNMTWQYKQVAPNTSFVATVTLVYCKNLDVWRLTVNSTYQQSNVTDDLFFVLESPAGIGCNNPITFDRIATADPNITPNLTAWTAHPACCEGQPCDLPEVRVEVSAASPCPDAGPCLCGAADCSFFDGTYIFGGPGGQLSVPVNYPSGPNGVAGDCLCGCFPAPAQYPPPPISCVAFVALSPFAFCDTSQADNPRWKWKVFFALHAGYAINGVTIYAPSAAYGSVVIPCASHGSGSFPLLYVGCNLCYASSAIITW